MDGQKVKNNPSRKIALLFFLLVIMLLFAALGLVETQTHALQRFLDDAIYDNRNHYLACEQLPALAEVERVLHEKHALIEEIEKVSPGNVGVEVGAPCPGKADLLFWYGSHQDRLEIEALIGAETFFGIPYRLQNR